jgi:hypothetical protein
MWLKVLRREGPALVEFFLVRSQHVVLKFFCGAASSHAVWMAANL